MIETTPPRDAGHAAPSRTELRTRLLADRKAFVASPAAEAALRTLCATLVDTLAALEPSCIGVYCPLGSESNVADAIAADVRLSKTTLALPYARREGRTMTYRRWRHGEPTVADGCGIGSSTGTGTEPDVVVVPCLGYTASGHRLGYGGGYYDRWLAAHPHVTAVGVAWWFAEVDAALFDARPHDVPLAVVVTDRGAR